LDWRQIQLTSKTSDWEAWATRPRAARSDAPAAQCFDANLVVASVGRCSPQRTAAAIVPDYGGPEGIRGVAVGRLNCGEESPAGTQHLNDPAQKTPRTAGGLSLPSASPGGLDGSPGWSLVRVRR